MTKKMSCGKCGGEQFNIMYDFSGEKWAECNHCGRPTSVFGDGWIMQQRYDSQ